MRQKMREERPTDSITDPEMVRKRERGKERGRGGERVRQKKEREGEAERMRAI